MAFAYEGKCIAMVLDSQTAPTDCQPLLYFFGDQRHRGLFVVDRADKRQLMFGGIMNAKGATSLAVDKVVSMPGGEVSAIGSCDLLYPNGGELQVYCHAVSSDGGQYSIRFQTTGIRHHVIIQP